MKPVLQAFLLLSFALIVRQTAAQDVEPLRFKSRIGFENERIVSYKFLERDGKVLLIGLKSIGVWDAETGRLLKSRPHEIAKLNESGTIVRISPDGRTAVAADFFSWRMIRKEKKVSATVWELQTGKQKAVLERPSESVRYAEWSADGSTLMTLSGVSNDERTEICFWDGDSFRLKSSIVLEGNLNFYHLSRDGKRFFASAEKDKYQPITGYSAKTRSGVWNTANGKIEQVFDSGTRLIFNPFSKTVSPDEKFFATNAPEKIPVWEIGGSDLPAHEIKLAKNNRVIWFRGFSSDGKLVIAEQNKTLEFYEAKTGKLVKSIPNIKKFEQLQFSPDGTKLVAQSCERADVFDFANGQKLFEIKLVCKSDLDLVSTSYRDWDNLQFHPAGKLLLTYSDKTVRVWNAQNGALVQTLVAPNRAALKNRDKNKDDGLRAAAGWIMNGKYLFASGADGKSVLLWKLTEN